MRNAPLVPENGSRRKIEYHQHIALMSRHLHLVGGQNQHPFLGHEDFAPGLSGIDQDSEKAGRL
jgi:hypothetical protein